MRTHPFHKEFEQLPFYSPPAQYIKSSGAQKKYCPLPGKLTCSTQYTYLFIMMKLILSLTLIWALSSTAGALQCQFCSNSNCSSTESSTCLSDTVCETSASLVTSSGTTGQYISKGCAPSSVCPVTGTQTTSYSFFDMRQVTSTNCCSTDNCNSETLPFPPAPTTNSLQCFTCNSNGSECSKLQCRGVEDHCFELDVSPGNGSIPLIGCVSANLCPIIMEDNGSCCATSLCNNAIITVAPTTTSTQSPTNTTTTSAATEACCFRLGVLHLLLGLLIFTLY